MMKITLETDTCTLTFSEKGYSPDVLEDALSRMVLAAQKDRANVFALESLDKSTHDD